jgi:peptidoglycan/LPS O-acetylase OafA/YrhL
VADNEPVTSPDQHKPGPRRAATVGAVVSAVVLVCLAFANNETDTGKPFLFTAAGLIIAALIADFVLRKKGLRR